MRRIPHPRSAFSLVEVTLAMGIAAFSLVVMLGVFGSVVKQRGELTSRKETYDAVAALQSHLNEPEMFTRVYNWIVAGASSGKAKELLYFRYRTNAAGSPDPAGSRYRAEWVDPGNSAELTPAKLSAAEGRWVRAALEWDDRADVNHAALAALPPTPEAYPHAHATLRVRCYPVPDANYTLPSTAKPSLISSLSLHR